MRSQSSAARHVILAIVTIAVEVFGNSLTTAPQPLIF